MTIPLLLTASFHALIPLLPTAYCIIAVSFMGDINVNALAPIPATHDASSPPCVASG